MSSMRIDGVDNKLLAEMVSNSLSQCFASSRTILHANNDSRVLMGARDALQRVVALTGTKPNSLGLLKRHNTSGIAGGPNVHCKSSANQCSSLQGVSEFGELATTDYYCMSDTDDLSTDFNLMDAASNELEEDGVEVEKVLAEIDEDSVLSIATNFKGATSICSRKKAKEQEKCVVRSHKGRKRAHSVHDGVIKLPNAFHSRWLSPQENSLMFTTPEEKNLFGRGKSRENNHSCFSTLYTSYKDKCYLDVQEKGTWSRLCIYMTRSCSTQSALHDWDRMNGLPASHARSMIKTGRSRKMLQNWLQSFVQHP